MAAEKYKELFSFSNGLLRAEHDRFNRIDEKAVKYLSVVTLLIGVEGAFGKYIIDGCIPPTTTWDRPLLAVGAVSFLVLMTTWFVIFRIFQN